MHALVHISVCVQESGQFSEKWYKFRKVLVTFDVKVRSTQFLMHTYIISINVHITFYACLPCQN